MSSCPVRPELDALPPRLRALKVDDRGYPVPWFVAWIDGKPEFRVMDPKKWLRAVRQCLCFTCGETLGRFLAFPIGPMCGVNRTTSEPPSHLECARWSVRNCPFLSRPKMIRREDDLTRELAGNTAGISIDRNPGVILIWNCTDYRIWDDGRGRPLIRIGPSWSVEWWTQGRPATRQEVEASVASGLPALRDLAAQEGHEAEEHLSLKVRVLEALYPPPAPDGIGA